MMDNRIQKISYELRIEYDFTDYHPTLIGIIGCFDIFLLLKDGERIKLEGDYNNSSKMDINNWEDKITEEEYKFIIEKLNGIIRNSIFEKLPKSLIGGVFFSKNEDVV